MEFVGKTKSNEKNIKILLYLFYYQTPIKVSQVILPLPQTFSYILLYKETRIENNFKENVLQRFSYPVKLLFFQS